MSTDPQRGGAEVFSKPSLSPTRRRLRRLSPLIIFSVLLALLLPFLLQLHGASVHATGKIKHHTAPANTAMTTSKADIARDGNYSNETILNTTNVNPTQFGLRVSYPVDGQVYAQPLFVPNVTIGSATYNVVYVATEHGSVYAFDADQTLAIAPLWHDSFINPTAGITSVPSADLYHKYPSFDIKPEVSITSTPVIDTSTNTMYVVAMTKENGTYVERLHALDITTGLDKPNSPVVITASVPGVGTDSMNGVVHFRTQTANQRAGLLLFNGIVYIAFGAFGDTDPYHGWILGYDKTTLKQTTAFSSTPSGSEGGIWQAGTGLSADPSDGSIYFEAGNGDADIFNGSNDVSDSVVKLSTAGGLQIADYFTPFNEACLQATNHDLVGGAILLPPQTGTTHTSLLLGGGKEGRIYLIDRTNMGKFTNIANPCANQNLSNVDKIVQELPPQTLAGGTFSSPSYWSDGTNQYVYEVGTTDHIKAFQLSNGLLSTSYISETPELFSYPGGNTVVSSNGSTPGTGIMWAISPPASCTTDHCNPSGSGALRAYDATNLSTELYSSSLNISRDGLANGYTKFTVPTVANGEVFVGTQSSLTIFGLLPTGSGGTLTGTFSTPTSTANLTKQGKTDWAQWGLTDATSFNHKANVTQKISNYVEIGPDAVSQFTGNKDNVGWSDGTPTTNTLKTPTSIAIIGTPTNGFSITVPADTTTRTLYVYVGIHKAQGKFTATLSDNSASQYADVSLNNSSSTVNGLYTLTYHAASNGQTLTVNFTLQNTFGSPSSVQLQAASLA